MTTGKPNSSQKIDQINEYIDRMPSLSTTVTRVLEICNKPNTSPNDLNKVISLDPVLTGQVLKLINSAYYSLPNQITSLTRAIIMLGLNTVKNLALSTAILGTLKKSQTGDIMSMDDFWTHSICVGVTAKALANRRGVHVTMLEEYFVAGLLHDLGKIPMCARFLGEYEEALELAVLEQGPLERAESLIFGFDHGQVGQMIAEKWQLNATLVESLHYHHHPEMAAEEHKQIVALVSLANLYANVYELGGAGDRYVGEYSIEHLEKAAGVTWQELVEMQDLIEQEIAKAQIFLQVSDKGD